MIAKRFYVFFQKFGNLHSVNISDSEILNTFKKIFENKIKNPNNNPKMIIFSGHDRYLIFFFYNY